MVPVEPVGDSQEIAGTTVATDCMAKVSGLKNMNMSEYACKASEKKLENKTTKNKYIQLLVQKLKTSAVQRRLRFLQARKAQSIRRLLGGTQGSLVPVDKKQICPTVRQRASVGIQIQTPFGLQKSSFPIKTRGEQNKSGSGTRFLKSPGILLSIVK